MRGFIAPLLAGAAVISAARRLSPRNVSCPVIFDGRVPSTASVSDFDTSNGGGWNPFNPDYVKGASLAWSDILKLPDATEPSLFDAESGTVPLEVTISDESIFQNQNGFRRAGLQFLADSNTASPATEGVVTVHFSVIQDEARPLNLSHEYLMVWHEAADYSANQFNFETGTIIGQESLPSDTFKLLSRTNQQLWSTPIEYGTWQNFAITLDFDQNTIEAWYSDGDNPLEVALEAVSNDNSGFGQYQFGILKKPTGTSDVVNSGYQESGIDEGQIYGSLFIEDSSGGCVSTQD